MIQRVQTLYLGVASIVFIVAAAAMNRGNPGGDPLATAVMIIAGLLSVTSLGSVFFFANRVKQRQIVRWARLGGVALFLSLGLLVFTAGRIGAVLAGKDVDLIVAVFGSGVALGLIFLAEAAIRRDIRLVKSMDRIR